MCMRGKAHTIRERKHDSQGNTYHCDTGFKMGQVLKSGRNMYTKQHSSVYQCDYWLLAVINYISINISIGIRIQQAYS